MNTTYFHFLSGLGCFDVAVALVPNKLCSTLLPSSLIILENFGIIIKNVFSSGYWEDSSVRSNRRLQKKIHYKKSPKNSQLTWIIGRKTRIFPYKIRKFFPNQQLLARKITSIRHCWCARASSIDHGRLSLAICPALSIKSDCNWWCPANKSVRSTCRFIVSYRFVVRVSQLTQNKSYQYVP